MHVAVRAGGWLVDTLCVAIQTSILCGDDAREVAKLRLVLANLAATARNGCLARQSMAGTSLSWFRCVVPHSGSVRERR
jgi:hypothetical protein